MLERTKQFQKETHSRIRIKLLNTPYFPLFPLFLPMERHCMCVFRLVPFVLIVNDHRYEDSFILDRICTIRSKTSLDRVTYPLRFDCFHGKVVCFDGICCHRFPTAYRSIIRFSNASGTCNMEPFLLVNPSSVRNFRSSPDLSSLSLPKIIKIRDILTV